MSENHRPDAGGSGLKAQVDLHQLLSEVQESERRFRLSRPPRPLRRCLPDDYAGELLALFLAGKTVAEVTRWLCNVKGVSVSYTTVMRWAMKNGVWKKRRTVDE